MSELMTIADYAKRENVTAQAVYNWINQQKITPEVVEGHYWIPSDTVRPKKRPPGRLPKPKLILS